MTNVFQEVRLQSKDMSKKRIVVAGGNGFLGSRICKSAVARGWDVTSLRYMPSSCLSYTTLANSIGQSIGRANMDICHSVVDSSSVVQVGDLG